VLEKEFMARVFFKWAFLKVKIGRPTHVETSNYVAKRGKACEVKKGGVDLIKYPPLLAK
jgi:hypothetical protein